MATVATVVAGLVLAAATAFGIVQAATDNPAGHSRPSSSITYGTGQ